MSELDRFIAEVFAVEGVRIGARSPVPDELFIDVSYSYERAARSNWTVARFIENRLSGWADDADFEVLDPDGKRVHGKTLMLNVRNAYSARPVRQPAATSKTEAASPAPPEFQPSGTPTRTLERIREDLEALSERWRDYSGSEVAAAQTFQNELIRAFTSEPDALAAGAQFEEFGPRDSGSGFMDLYWRDVCIIEMKAPSQSKRLDQHREQALDYWRNSARPDEQIGAPPFLVLCSFHRFEIWEPGRFPNRPRDVFELKDLADRAEALSFLAGRRPIFGGSGEAVTQKAARHMVQLYERLRAREAATADEVRHFIMQTVWALFAEDLGMLEGKPVESLLRSLRSQLDRSSATDLADLYRRLNVRDANIRNRGIARPVPYVNGALFAEPSVIHLTADELDSVIKAAEYDWRYVNPTVFGSLMEGCLGRDRRWELGAHYTSEEDIMLIVEPVIIRPWIERIEAVTKFRDGIRLLDEFCKFTVLDPAMGCGNFLAVAYRELRRLEERLHDRIQELSRAEGRDVPMGMSWFPLSNLKGIEIEPFAVETAKITMWMTHALESRKHETNEATLPLPDLDGLVVGDSLKDSWPAVDAVIGNPPFHGDRNLRGVLGDDYIDWLEDEFGVGVKDHCVYFFLRAQENLKSGCRAGLVATNTIAQSKNRDASLVRIEQTGGVITDAVKTKVWSGEAKVHVAIVCWQKDPPHPPPTTLDGKPVVGITPSLTEGLLHREARQLAGNAGICFQGFLTRGMGFVIDDVEANDLLSDTSAPYSDVVRRFMNGADTVDTIGQEPTRWVIDFADWPLERAGKYPRALEIVRERHKPLIKDPKQMERWWQFWNVRKGLRGRSLGLKRVACCALTAKRLLLVWADASWRPSHACGVFTFDDDVNFGICSSQIHSAWARRVGSSLKADLRYTPSTAFETFPFPDVAAGEDIATGARDIVRARRRHCDDLQIGLTKLYNLMDEGGVRDLADAHKRLDYAVADAYGWDRSILDDERALLDALFDLNELRAEDPNYQPFGR